MALSAKERAYHRKYRKTHRKRIRTYYRAWCKTPAGVLHARRANWRKRGVDVTAAETALRAHKGSCEICAARKSGGTGSWHVDHDSRTGRVRGVLCCNCNRALGYLCDDPVVVERAARYLRKSR